MVVFLKKINLFIFLDKGVIKKMVVYSLLECQNLLDDQMRQYQSYLGGL